MPEVSSTEVSSRIPVLFKGAAIAFFLLGLLAVPLSSRLGGNGAVFKVVVYLAAAVVFWLWLRRDAVAHRVSGSWQLLVAAAWLVAAFPVAPLYLMVTRGWRRGSIAVVVLFALVLGYFALFALGTYFSVQASNALRIS